MNPNQTCSYAGFQASKILMSGSLTADQTIYSKFDPAFVEINIIKSRYKSLRNLNPVAKSYFLDAKNFPKIKMINPTFYVKILFT